MKKEIKREVRGFVEEHRGTKPVREKKKTVNFKRGDLRGRY